jgi:hypothetical protein
VSEENPHVDYVCRSCHLKWVEHNQRIKKYLRSAPEHYQQQLINPELRQALAKKIIEQCSELSDEELQHFFRLPMNFNVVPARARLSLADRQALYSSIPEHFSRVQAQSIPDASSTLQAQFMSMFNRVFDILFKEQPIFIRVFNAWFEAQPGIVKEHYLASPNAREFKKNECERAFQILPSAGQEQVVQQKWQDIMQSDLSYRALTEIFTRNFYTINN